MSPEVFSSRLRSISSCDARAELARVSVPALYLQAANDRVVPARCLDEILAIRPDVTVARIDGPHLLLQREPRQAAEIVTDFIRQLP
jgi:pimeloyl-ACP methyl ester carboxylesterase